MQEELRDKFLPQFVEETFRLLYSELLLFRDLKIGAASGVDRILKPDDLLRTGQNDVCTRNRKA